MCYAYRVTRTEDIEKWGASILCLVHWVCPSIDEKPAAFLRPLPFHKTCKIVYKSEKGNDEEVDGFIGVTQILVPAIHINVGMLR